jgi:hypothetical protein
VNKSVPAIITWLLAALIAPAARAQSALSLRSENGYTGNAFANQLALPDYFTVMNAAAHQDWLGEREGLRLYYDGSLTAFNHYGERSYHTHEIGIAWYRLEGEAGHRLDAGLNISGRFHTPDYQLYQQEQLQLYANLKYLITSQWFAYAGGSWTLRRYPGLTPLSHSRDLLYLRSSLFFATGTTLILETDLISKAYAGSMGAPSTAFADVVTTGGGRASQLLLTARLAQGITPKTGLSAEYQLRHNLATTTRYLGSSEGLYYSDEELFEDFFDYSGGALQLGLRQKFPRAITLALNGRREHRAWADRPAADLGGEPYADGRLRDDLRTSVWLELQKRVTLKSGWQPLTLTFSLSWLRNRSNDSWYDYQSQYIGFGISQEF